MSTPTRKPTTALRASPTARRPFCPPRILHLPFPASATVNRVSAPAPHPEVWSVALPLPLPPYDFAAPHGWSGALPLGCRVLVPWQGELRVGVVVGEGGALTGRSREAVWVLDETPWVSAPFMAALAQQAALARTPPGLLWGDLLGVGWTPGLKHRVRAVPGADLGTFGERVPGPDWAEADPEQAASLDAIRAQGLLDERFELQPRTRPVYRARALGEKDLTPKQRLAWAALQDLGEAESQLQWAEAAGVSVSTIAGVLARGWAEQVQTPAPPPELPELSLKPPRPTPDTLPETEVWRLHGGRSAERHRLLAARLRRVLELGRGALLIAPDGTSLRRLWADLSALAAEAGTQAVCFSGVLNEAQREHAWGLVASGEARLVAGTALALAAPLHDLGLVVVEEEASEAHKLLSGARVFVPQLAARLAEAAGCPLALTGSVPAAESVGHPGVVLPPPPARLHVVDYANPQVQPALGPLSSPHLKPGDLGYPISHDLARVLRQVAERGRQAVLLAPRRGYSALLRCPSCEHTPQCRHCDVPLRFHQETRRLACHQCGYSEALHERCENCGEPMWQAKGPGTEWILGEVKKLLPGFPLARYDKDRQDDLSAWMRGEPGVIVGTQALLSLDAPPDLALIGVTLADTWLNVSDFRASERYHRLLRQLLEWHPSRAPLLLVQTFQADHPALRAVVDNLDALHYPVQEWQARQALSYPPHAVMAQVEVAARDQGRAREVAYEVAQALYGGGAAEREVLGPAPSPVARLRGVYPYHLLLRARDEARLSQMLASLDRPWRARVRLDVSPR